MFCYSGRDVQLPEIARNLLKYSTPLRFPNALREAPVTTVSSHADFQLPQAFLCYFITVRPARSNSHIISLTGEVDRSKTP